MRSAACAATPRVGRRTPFGDDVSGSQMPNPCENYGLATRVHTEATRVNERTLGIFFRGQMQATRAELFGRVGPKPWGLSDRFASFEMPTRVEFWG